MKIYDHDRIKQLMPTMTDSMIAREVGCTKENIRQLRTKWGIETPNKGLRCDIYIEDKIAELIELAKTKTPLEMAKILGTNYKTIISKLHELKIKHINSPQIKRELFFKHWNGNISETSKLSGLPYSTCHKYASFLRGYTTKSEKTWNRSPESGEKTKADFIKHWNGNVIETSEKCGINYSWGMKLAQMLGLRTTSKNRSDGAKKAWATRRKNMNKGGGLG